MKTPLTTFCAYVMVFALLAFGLAYLSTMLPPEYAPPADFARFISVASLMLALTAATFASMKSTEWAETAFRAGRGHRHTLIFACLFTIACIVIEVTMGKMGAFLVLGVDIGRAGTFWLTAMLSFFAVAPRLLAAIQNGVEAIALAEVKADDNVEHTRTLERIEAAGRASSQRIQAGVSNLDQERVARKLGGGALIGAAAALIAGGGAPAEAAMTYPASEVVSTVSTPRVNEEAALMPVGPQHAKAYARMIEILEQNPSLSNRRLGRAISVSHPTIKVWRRHYRAQQALAFSGNAGLLDAA